MKKKPAKLPKPDPGVFHPGSLTKEDAKDLFDRLWEINEVTEMCNRLSRLTGRDHQWSFSQRRGADADEPLYQVWAIVGPRTTSSLRMVEHMVSGPFKAIAHYSLGVASFAKEMAARRSVPNDRPLPKTTKRKKRRAKKSNGLGNPVPVPKGELMKVPIISAKVGPKFKAGQLIKGDDAVQRRVAKVLRHGSHSYKYRMDDGSIWTQAELTAIMTPDPAVIKLK